MAGSGTHVGGWYFEMWNVSLKSCWNAQGLVGRIEEWKPLLNADVQRSRKRRLWGNNQIQSHRELKSGWRNLKDPDRQLQTDSWNVSVADCHKHDLLHTCKCLNKTSSIWDCFNCATNRIEICFDSIWTTFSCISITLFTMNQTITPKTCLEITSHVLH